MAFPIVRDYHTASNTSDVTSHSIQLPTSINTGDLLVVFFTCDDADVVISIDTGASGNNWTISEEVYSSSSSSVIVYKTAEASNVLTLTTDSSQKSTGMSYSVYGHGSFAPEYQSANGSSTNINPPSLTPGHSTRDYLWLVFGGTGSDVVASAAPTNFTDLHTIAGAADSSSTSSAQRNLVRGPLAYDPGPFTSATADWTSFTVAVGEPDRIGFSVTNIGYYQA